MSLAIGRRLGSYEILSALGAGGMGEVYRARDRKLNRDVAIKVLPDSYSLEPDRLARFRREAQLLASLNHPNIAQIYGLEDADETTALVMELVGGPTLADRIAQGPIPYEEALPIAKQIAEGLENAHEQGVIHRDLKPANIKLRPDGTVKILDFGLAKALDPTPAGGSNATMSPTLSIHATQLGIVLGTAAYMSPEQVRGRPVDRRADIWAFGCVLYEMLTGRRAFPGDDVTDVIVTVVSREPDWQSLPPIAAGIRRLLARCLAKDPKSRLRDIGEARVQIDEAIAGKADVTSTAASAVAVETSSKRLRTIATVSAAVAAAFTAGAFVTWSLWRPPQDRNEPIRFSIVSTDAQRLVRMTIDRALALSPDGTHLAYMVGADISGGASLGGGQLMVRAMRQLTATAVRGAVAARSPFFSPDGKWIGYSDANANAALKRVSITGGPSLAICSVSGTVFGGTWGSDDRIIFATSDPNTGLLSVPSGGGEPIVLTKPDNSRGERDHLFPSFLPGGRVVLYTIVPAGGGGFGMGLEHSQVAALDLDTGQTKILIRGGGIGAYVEEAAVNRSRARGTGFLIYAVPGSLRAVRFNPTSLTVLSDPVPVVDEVSTVNFTAAAQFSLSATGMLAYMPGGVSGGASIGGTGVPKPLVWVDRHGQEEPIPAATPRDYTSLRLSPDETRVALDARDQQADIWIYDFTRHTNVRLTLDPQIDGFPFWTPDGRYIIFESSRSGNFNVYRQAADGAGPVETLTKGSTWRWPLALSPDGSRLVLHVGSGGSQADLELLVLDGKSEPSPLMKTPFNEDHADISPDGRWIAYESNESGQVEIHVRPFPDVNAGHWQVSTAGGIRPVWARNGRELSYLAGRAMMSVPIQTTQGFSFGTPTKLFEGSYFSSQLGRKYDVTRDGRFLMIKNPQPAAGETTPSSIVVVVNWIEELKRLVPGARP